MVEIASTVVEKRMAGDTGFKPVIMELMGYENVNINTACCILIVMLFNLAGCLEI